MKASQSGANSIPRYLGLEVSTSANGRAIPIVYGTQRLDSQTIWAGNLKTTSVNIGKGGGKGGGMVNYSIDIMQAICEGPIVAVTALKDAGGYFYRDLSLPASAQPVTKGVVINASGTMYVKKPVVIELGYQEQPVWPYLSGIAPSQAISYHRTALLAANNYNLGSTAMPPSVQCYIIGIGPYDLGGAITGQSIADAEPSQIIVDLLSNPVHGFVPAAFLPRAITYPYASYIGDLTKFRDYCVAAGLFLSVIIEGQERFSDVLDRIMQATTCASFWSEGQVKIEPYWDNTLTNNGRTYTACNGIAFSLSPKHFLVEGKDEAPVVVTRSSISDAYNHIDASYADRALNYGTNTTTADDLNQQQLYGFRPAQPVNCDYITTLGTARMAAQLMLQRQAYIRNTYSFKLPPIFCQLEPMDFLTISDPGLALSNKRVRISEIQYDDRGTMTFKCEDAPSQVATAIQYSAQQALGNQVGGFGLPGALQPPLIFTAPSELTNFLNPELWIAVAPQDPTSWGGCHIWLSLDGSSYRQIGVTYQPARYGALTNNWGAPSSLAPGYYDTGTALKTTVYANGQLSSVSQAAANSGATISLVLDSGGNELFSYQNATLKSSSNNVNTYQLDHFYRAQYGTASGKHPAGCPFVRLDTGVFQYGLNGLQVGTTVYLKFTSFNLLGSYEDDLSSAIQYQYQVGLPFGTGPNVESFVVGQNGYYTTFQWAAIDLSNFPAVVGYEVRYAPVSESFVWNSAKTAIFVTQGSFAQAYLSPGTYNFGISTVDRYGNASSTPFMVQFTVPAYTYQLNDDSAAKHWDDFTLYHLIVHPTTQALVPDSSVAMNYVPAGGTGWEVFDSMVYAAYNDGTGDTGTIDLGAVYTGRVTGLLLDAAWPQSGHSIPDPLPQPTATLTHAIVHPTTGYYLPDSTVLANTTMDIFGQMVISPYSAPVVTLVYNLGDNFTVKATTAPAIALAVGETTAAAQPTVAVSYSNDGTIFNSGSSVGASAQYVKIAVTLQESSGENYLIAVNTACAPAAVQSPTGAQLQIRTAQEIAAWSPWTTLTGQVATLRYLEAKFTDPQVPFEGPILNVLLEVDV